MNWNSLKKLSTFSKNHPIYVENENLYSYDNKYSNDLEFYIQNMLKLEKICKSILKNTDKLTKIIFSLNIFQSKLTEDLTSCDLCKQYCSDLRSLVEGWHTSNKKVVELADDYNLSIQKIIVLPLKQYKQILEALKKIVKKSENLQMELNKKKLRVQKLEEKEKTANNLVRLDECNSQLEKLNTEFKKQSETLLLELPDFLESRKEYFQPTLEGFIKSETFFWGEALKTFTLKNQNNVSKFTVNNIDLNQHKKDQNQLLSKISALSIVEGTS